MRRIALLLVPLLASGCFLDRSGVGGDDGAPDAQPPQGRDGGPPRDAGPPADAGSPLDAGGREDAGIPALDGGPACTIGDERCQGLIAHRCVDGEPMEDRCANACWEDPTSGPRCVTCIPAASRCTEDGRAVEVCGPSGDSWDGSNCSLGCDVSTGQCRPPTPCTEFTVDAVLTPTASAAPGRRFNLCMSEENRRYHSSVNPGNCDGHDGNDSTPTVTDILVRLEIAHAGTYRFQVDDADSTAAIAPLVYIRTACAEPSSQLNCWDNIYNNTDFRYLDFEVVLAPGDYFVIIDGYEYNRQGTRNDPTCGVVEVRITEVSR